MMTDIEIAQSVVMKPITEIADTAGIERKYLEQYGNYKAKVDLLSIIKGDSVVFPIFADLHTLSVDFEWTQDILEVLKIYGYDISTWYVREIRTGANGIPCTIDVPAGYVISWKV